MIELSGNPRSKRTYISKAVEVNICCSHCIHWVTYSDVFTDCGRIRSQDELWSTVVPNNWHGNQGPLGLGEAGRAQVIGSHSQLKGIRLSNHTPTEKERKLKHVKTRESEQKLTYTPNHCHLLIIKANANTSILMLISWHTDQWTIGWTDR